MGNLTRRSFLRTMGVTASGIVLATVIPAAVPAAHASGGCSGCACKQHPCSCGCYVCGCGLHNQMTPARSADFQSLHTGYDGPQGKGLEGCPGDNIREVMKLLGKGPDPKDIDEAAQYWTWNPNRPGHEKEVNGYWYRGPLDQFTVPTGFGGARIDWWDRFKQGATGEGGTTPHIVEATLWLNRCNP